MKIAFVVERPTQFEAPFFRHVAAQAPGALSVYFTGSDPAQAVADPELGRAVDWGFDLLAGYAHRTVPASAGITWWRSELVGRGFDLVVINGWSQAAYARAALACRGRVPRLALRLDTVLFDGAPSVVRAFFVRRVLGGVFDRFLATGSGARGYVEACGVGPARIGLFPYAIDTDAFRSPDAAARSALRRALGMAESAILVLAVAKFSSREAPWDLLNAALITRDPRFHFRVVGAGPLRDEVARAASRAPAGRVVLHGYAPYLELPRLYAASDVFVHAPQEERWGVSVAEALAAGLPVVASSRVGAAQDLVEPGCNGFLYHSGRAEDLAARLLQAAALPVADVRQTSARVLSQWNYAAAWRELQRAAAS
jgi:glycosyltransferase involved in cell wall biosynthesis